MMNTPFKEGHFYAEEHKPDEWETLLERNKFWKTLRVTAWALRFQNNSLAKRQRLRKLTGPLTTEEIVNAREHWVKKVQSNTSPNLQAPGWELVKDDTSILRCKGRIPVTILYTSREACLAKSSSFIRRNK